MATVYSTQRTNALAIPTVNSEPIDLSGRVRIAHGKYTAAALQINDVIDMVLLPNGARLVSGFLAHGALGSTTSISVGYAAHKDSAKATVALDAVAYKAAASTASAAKVDILATLALGSGTVTNTDENGVAITCTLTGAAATGDIELTVLYVID
jgi:hypothetical protein